VILIASSSAESLARWTLGLRGLGAVLAVSQLDALQQGLIRIGPRVLLLDMDLPGVNGAAGVASLRKRNPATGIVALSRTVSDETELALFKSGVRGCCRSDIDPQLLGRVVVAIQQGELWIRRSLTHRLLDEFGEKLRRENRIAASTVSRLKDLTLREREIAALIGNGDSNKQIARQLAITERTVKAHLTGIFRKLGIADRLGLALRVTANVEAEREHV
jgi:two-component system NarL family response regulator